MTIEIVGVIGPEAIISDDARDRSLTTASPILQDPHQALVDLAAATLRRSRERSSSDLVHHRTIWMFWGGPLPSHLAACIGKAEQLSGTCELVVVEPETARRFAPDLPAEWEGLQSWAHKSDVLAPHLLHRHGGLYVDVDTVAVAPIDHLIEDFVASDEDYVAYSNAQQAPSVGVMWSRSGSAVAAAYKARLDEALGAGTEDLDWVASGDAAARRRFRSLRA